MRRKTHARLPLDDCQNIEEVLKLVINHLDKMPPNDTAAAWLFMNRFITKDVGRTNSNLSLQQEQELYTVILTAVMKHTMKSLKSYPKHLTTIISSMAKIATNVQKANRLGRTNIYQQAFGAVLLDENSNPREDVFSRFATAASRQLHKFEPRNLSDVAYAYALLDYNPTLDAGGTLFERIGDQSMYLLDEFEPIGISILTWSFATANVHHDDLYNNIGDHIMALTDLGSFGPQSLSNIVWAFTKLNLEQPGLFIKIGNHIAELEDLNLFKPQELSSIVYSFAKSGIQHSGVFDKIAEHIVSLHHLRSFKPQELANIAWAYAFAGASHSELFKKIGKHIVELDRLSSYNSVDLTNLVWAYARADQTNPGLFDKLGNAIIELHDSSPINTQHLGNIVWAYAKLNQQHPDLFKRIGDSIVGSEDFDAQALSNILWAYASSGIQDRILFRKVSEYIITLDDLNGFNPQALSNIVWAFATAGMRQPALFQKINDHITGLDDLKVFKPQDHSNIVWAYATMNDCRADLFERIRDAIIDQGDFHSFDPQALTNLAWSYAVADVDGASLFNHDFINALVARQNDFSDDELRQLHQWNLWHTEENLLTGLPERLKKRCHHIFSTTRTTTSKLQDDVTAELTSMELSLTGEYLTPTGYSVDVMVQIDGKQIGIEVDGPFHFIDRKPIGSTVLKHRQIITLDNIPLISIPYWEWEGLGNDQRLRQEYLRSLLESINAVEVVGN